MKLTSADITRFWGKVLKREAGCWEWQGALFKCGRYGAFRLHGQTVRAHRVAFFLMKGNLDATLELLHLCHNPCCVNPGHLKQATHSENLRQAGALGRMTRALGANSRLNFSEETITDILTNKCSARALARKYQVDHHTIRRFQKELELCQQSQE